MASNGLKLKLITEILLVSSSPLMLFVLAASIVQKDAYRLALASVFLFLGILAGCMATSRVIVLLQRSYDREKELEMQIIQKDKLAAIGLLTAGIAHELNTPLASALLNTQMLKEDTKKTWPDQTPVLDSIEEEIKRAGSVVRNLLEFSRQTQVQSTVTDVNGVLTKLLDISAKLCSEKGIHVHRNLVPGIPIARGNASILHQVFMNIVSNAIEAMEDGGILT
ncbi:MAG: histidine kinase dimerization/phospho-acceptor domain-containing protein, partial [Syntrophorhabdaceae bacterium]|nr:histidine kinase dimerization/phospho-acceptor domain-containing protein [Syntrophorhabdaceae bacterium]